MEPESNPLDLLRQRRAMNRVEAAMRKTEETPKPGGYRYLGRNADTGQGLVVGNDGSVIPGDVITSGHVKPGQAVRVAQAGGMVQLDQKPRVRKVAPPVVKKEEYGNVKVLFSVRDGDETIVYIGADRKIPTEIYRYRTADYRQFTPRMTNTGRGKNKFTASALALLSLDPDADPAGYQSRVIIDLKTKEQVTIEPDLWVPPTYGGTSISDYFSIDLYFTGNGFYTAGSRQGGQFGYNQLPGIPATATIPTPSIPDLVLFSSAWGPGGGGYNSGTVDIDVDMGFSFSIKSRNYTLQVGSNLETILGDASLYDTLYIRFPQPSSPGYSTSSWGHLEQIDVNLGLNITDTVYYKFDVFNTAFSRSPDTALVVRNVRCPSTSIVGDRGVIAQVNNVEYSYVQPGNTESDNTYTTYYYKSTDGTQVDLPPNIFAYPFPGRNNFNVVGNYNLVGSTLYCCDTYLSDFYTGSLPRKDSVDVAIISLDGSTTIKQQKIDPLPESGTIIHNISYHP
jgi:hypothetical protein